MFNNPLKAYDNPPPDLTYIAVFCSGAFLRLETQPSRELARAFISGMDCAGCLLNNIEQKSEVSGYVMPDDKAAMEQYEHSEEAQKAIEEYHAIVK